METQENWPSSSKLEYFWLKPVFFLFYNHRFETQKIFLDLKAEKSQTIINTS